MHLMAFWEMHLHKLSITIATLLIFGDVAEATPLWLQAVGSNGADAIATPGEESELVYVRVVNQSTPDDRADFLTGWQLSLSIQPQAGASGQLVFANPATGTAQEPADYVLEGASFEIVVENSGTDLDAFDVNFPFTGGVQVPIDPGAVLLSVEFLASSDANGDFDILAVNTSNSSRRTEWANAASPVQLAQAFANVPFGIGAVRIGTVRVIPEPSSYCLILSALLVPTFLARST